VLTLDEPSYTGHKPTQHDLSSFFVLSGTRTLLLLRLVGRCRLEMEVVEAAQGENVVTAAVGEAVIFVVDTGLAVTYPPSCRAGTAPEEAVAALYIPVLLVPCFFLFVRIEIPVAHERYLAQSTHSFHDRDRWHRGYVLVEAAETLTWAERGKPLDERCRTPLWPNSDLKKTAPDLTFLAVRRARYTNVRDGTLRIAWK
jgi:hypothetical protein